MGDKIGFGMTIGRETVTPGTYEDMGSFRVITPPTKTRDARENTNHKSSGGWRTYIGGMKDGGEVELEVAFNPAGDTYTDLEADLENPDPVGYQIGGPWGTAKCTLDGLVTELGPQTPMEDLMVYRVKIKVSGEPVWAAGA